jgi:hypothetical protein
MFYDSAVASALARRLDCFISGLLRCVSGEFATLSAAAGGHFSAGA